MDLRRAATSGALWVGAGVWLGRLTTTLVVVILSRILEPEEFGLAALALTFVLLASALVESGLSRAVVQFRDLDDHDIDTAFALSLVMAGLVTGGVLLAAPAIESLFDQPGLADVLRVLTLTFPLGALQFVPAALLERRVLFRTLATRRIIATLAGGVTAVVAALMGAGVYALVLQPVVFELVAVLVLWSALPGRRPRPRPHRERVRPLVTFATPALASALIGFTGNNMDKLLVGTQLGARALGFYMVGARLVTVAMEVISQVLNQLSLTVFSRLQDDRPALRRAYYEATRSSTLALAPVLIGLAATAPVVVPLLFGERWLPSVGILQALALGGVVISLAYFDSSTLQAVGRPALALKLAVLVTTGYVVAILVGLRFGATGVAVALGIAGLLLWPLRLRVLSSAVGLSARTVLVQWGRPVAAASVMALAVLLLLHLTGGPSWVQLLAAVTLGAGVYVAALRVLDPSGLSGLMASLRSALGRDGGPQASRREDLEVPQP